MNHKLSEYLDMVRFERLDFEEFASSLNKLKSTGYELIPLDKENGIYTNEITLCAWACWVGRAVKEYEGQLIMADDILELERKLK